MMMEENNSKKILLSVLGVAILVVAVVGVSFAAFNTTEETDDNTITVGQITMSYAEPTDVLGITDAVPYSEDEGMDQTKSFNFSVSTHATTDDDDVTGVTIPYEINVTPVASTEYAQLQPAQVKVGLRETTQNATTTDVISKVSELVASTYREGAKKVFSTSDVYKQGATDTITRSYELRMWISDDVEQTDINDEIHEYKLKVNVDSRVLPIGKTN